MASMLGKGATLPDDCTLTAAGVAYTVIEAHYACPAGEVVFELAHPSKATSTATVTENFAITLHSGSPPQSLADVLAALIRSREADFNWTWPASDDEEAAEDAQNEEDDRLLGDPHW